MGCRLPGSFPDSNKSGKMLKRTRAHLFIKQMGGGVWAVDNVFFRNSLRSRPVGLVWLSFSSQVSFVSVVSVVSFGSIVSVVIVDCC